MDTKKERARRKLYADLKVGIYRGRKLLRVVKIPDPRNNFIASWNGFFKGDSDHAAPLRKAVRS